MAEHPWTAGKILAGRYRLESQLGVGGMGAIWRAQHLVLQAPVAVKLIDPEIAQQADNVARFMREAQSAASLRSPHVVQIIDYGMDGLVPFIVMELLEGETLSDRIKRGRLSPSETVRILTQVARAVHRAHEASIVHRDLKPENVFLVHNQDEDVAKVLDFGVAKVNVTKLGTSDARTKTGLLLGTPYYMSPEQAQGNKAVDHRSDLWSLGVMAFEMLTGQRPFYSDGLGELVLQICVRDVPVPSTIAPVPHGFDAWFARATARDPDQRFQSAKELADALREALGVEGRETLGTFPGISAAPVSAGSAIDPMSASVRVPGQELEQLSRAPTLLQDTGKPSLTLQQFGTESLHEPPKSSVNSLVLAVGATALIVGATTAVFLFRGRNTADAERTSPSAVSSGPTDQVGATPTAPGEPSATAEPRPQVAPIEPSSDTPASAGEPRGEAPARPAPPASASAQPTRPEAPRGSTEAGSPAPAADGGWVKPEWARPDDEPPVQPQEPVFPTPAPVADAGAAAPPLLDGGS